FVLRPAVRVAHQRNRQVHPHGFPVLAQVALLEVDRFDLTVAHALALGVGHAAVVRVRYVLHGAARQFLRRVPEDPAQRAVGLDEAAFQVDMPDAGGGKLERLAEALLALAQRALGLLAAGDVDDGAHQARHLAVRAEESRLVVYGAARAAGAGRDLYFVALAGGRLPEFLIHRQVFGRHPGTARIQVGHQLAEERRALDTEEFLPRAVDAQVAPVARLQVHRHRQDVDQFLRGALRLGEVAARLREHRQDGIGHAAADG